MKNSYLLLGGAPKCGTSSLFNHLAEYDGINPSDPKETFYFLDDDHPLLRKNTNIHLHGVEGFSQFFSPGFGIRLEGTTHLLYQQQLFGEVEKLPGVKLVFVLREPARRLYSSFLYTKENLANFKQEVSFYQYASLLRSGKQKELENYVKKGASLYVLQRDLEYGEYNKYLYPWIKALGRENCYVLIFEELIADQAKEMAQLVNWLGLSNSPEPKQHFEKRNATVSIRNKRAHAYARKVSTYLPSGNWKKNR